MSVTALFEPDRISASPGETAALTLRLQNLSDAERMVKLRAGGGLAAQTVLQTETIYLDPNELFEVPVIVDANPGLPAGPHSCIIEVDDDGETSNAAATVEIIESAAFVGRLEPTSSRSAVAGRHRVVIDNRGNVPILVELDVTASEELIPELAVPAINIDPGKTAKVELRLSPHHRFWSGAPVEHPFGVGLVASNGESTSLEGVYTQGPRVRPWLLPALVGMLGSLLVGALLWFTWLRPAVEERARDDAAELDLLQNTVIEAQVREMQAAAAEASELPLGEPIDLRLEVSAPTGGLDASVFTFDPDGDGRVLSITDVVLQNPDGAVGSVRILRDEDVLLESNLANFRDLDFHFVAPFRFENRMQLSMEVSCDTPGPGADTCDVGATVIGFVDDA